MLGKLMGYLDSIKARDPAARSRLEILFYPGVIALGLHRVAHWLFRHRAYFLARLVNHFSRLITAIDIHPGASIGRNFFIDHGFVVIGETAEIHDNVTIYQGATLGGTNPTNGKGGKRHPTICEGAIISLGAAVLGPIVIGARARIGANAVVTKDVAEGAVMTGIPARAALVDAVDASEYTRDFVLYATRYCDNQDKQIDRLNKEVATLRKRLDKLERADKGGK